VADPSRGPGSVLPRLVLLGILWGATFPISRLGVAAGANPFVLVTIAFGIAAAVSAPAAVASRSPFPSWRSLAESAGVGALLIGGINLPLFWGERFATGGVASIVYATAPMVSLAFVWLLRTGERFGARTGFALVLGLGGVVVLALASGGAAITNPWGLVSFGIGAVCQGTGAVALGRLRPRGEGAWGETFQFVGGGIASLAVVAVLAPKISIAWSASVVVSVLYVGVVSMVIGYALFFDMIRRHGAVEANQVTFLNPVVALVLGVVVFAEPFAIEEIGGLALILLALALLHLPGPPRPSSRTPSGGAPGPPEEPERRPDRTDGSREARQS
jgi:drug/metabolite transporter (DMT)-like permease